MEQNITANPVFSIPDADYDIIPLGDCAADIFELSEIPSDFVLPGFVAGTVGALIAPGSTGKSMLAMELAAVAAGASILGEAWTPLKTGEVLILAVEDPKNELHNRWISLGKSLTKEEKEANRRVQVVPMFGKSADIMDPAFFGALVRRCNGKRLLILDTFRRVHSLNENDSGDMAKVIGKFEEFALLTGCAVLFLHHTSKNASMNGQGGEQQASRGSSVLVDNIRFQMFMVDMNAEAVKAEHLDVEPEDFKRYVKLGVSKVNYGPKIGEVWLARCEGGILKPVDDLEFRAYPPATTKTVATVKAEEHDDDDFN